ncbi:hypothetical protein CFC21_072358 [Triticum aestivum]|uniref:Uncharacterized protein n=3 Tax=Triticum TaxID=4564 RepID=A0A9R0XCL8_TRITD|nr:uncharacterized protein LOC123112527 isoform X2 [Triticum aestivum]KAF7066360.1 hypothetical protein CFC21_072358 [Triticum aestivum]VAI34122.1 unnamed protein product [Triticum turgidum subsp. durum]
MEGDEAARRGREALSGGHLCHVCGHQYPNPNPSAKLRRSHRRNSCRKVTPSAEEEDAGPRNAGEGRLVLGAAGGPGDGEEPGNGAASGGSASPGSANGGVESVEDRENAEHASPNAARIQAITSDYIETGLIPNNSAVTADEGNGTDSERPCTNGMQHKVPESFTEIGQLAVAHPTEREDCLEEYQDASSFLHQSDPEDGAAIARESDVPMEIKNLDKGSVGSSVAADVISLERYDTCKYQFSRESSMTDFPAGSEVENEAEYYAENRTPGLVRREDVLNLQSTGDCSADIDSNNADFVVDSKSDKTSGSCEFIGDLNPSSLQKCSPLMSDPGSQSACSRKVDSFFKDGMEVLDCMSEVSPREEIVESYPIGSETTSNSGDEVKLIHTESTSTDHSTERSSQNFSAQDTSGVQLPDGNSCLVNSVCSVPGYKNDLAVTNVDGMLKSNAEENCSEGILVKGSALDSSCEARSEQQEDICNRESATEVPTNYQVSTSQEHVTLLMDQVTSTKNPFNVDDTRSDDLFELASGYHLEAPNVFESEQEVDSTSQTVSNQTSVADGKHCPISDDRMVAVSSKNGYAVDAEDASVSSSADSAKNVFLHDALVNHDKKEGESHTNGIIDAPSQVFLTEFGTMPDSQEINAVSTHVEEKTGTEDTKAKDETPVENIDDSEEKKQTEDASAKEMTAVLHSDNVEEDKLAKDTGSKEVTAVQSTENIHEKVQTEDDRAKKIDGEFNTADVGNRQTDVASKEEKTDEVQQTDNAEEKKQAPETTAKETNAVQSRDQAEERKQAEGTVGLEGNKQNGEIAAVGSRLNSARISVPLKVLLAEASLEGKEKKPSTKERVLSFTRRGASKDDASSAKPGPAGSDDQYWNSPAKMPHDNNNNVDKRSKVRKQPWMPFICCHSVH